LDAAVAVPLGGNGGKPAALALLPVVVLVFPCTTLYVIVLLFVSPLLLLTTAVFVGFVVVVVVSFTCLNSDFISWLSMSLRNLSSDLRDVNCCCCFRVKASRSHIGLRTPMLIHRGNGWIRIQICVIRW
jgi:hypothetical protein